MNVRNADAVLFPQRPFILSFNCNMGDSSNKPSISSLCSIETRNAIKPPYQLFIDY